MKILNLENEENQELLQEIKNRVDKDKLCFQEKKVQAFQECFRPFLPSKHVYTPFPITDILSTILDKDTMPSEDTKHLCKIGLHSPISKKTKQKSY